MKKLLVALSLALAAAAFLFVACSDNTSSVSTRNYLGTQSPGDVWSWTITTDAYSSGTFSARNETLDRDYSGTVSILPNRFLKLLVTATTDTTITIPGTAYALEVPNTALVIKPDGSGSDVIVAVARGACPTASATYNLVQMPETGWNYLADSAYDVADVTISGSHVDAVITSYLISGSTLTTESDTGATCSNGTITKPGDPMVIGIAPSGVIINDAGPGGGGTFGMQAPAGNVDLNDVVLTGREFRGVLFKQNSVGSDDTLPLWIRPDGTGGLKGGNYLDFEAGTEDVSQTAVIDFGAQASPGIVNSLKTDDVGTASERTMDIVLMINRISGKYFIYGISTDPGYGYIPEVFIAIEQ